MSKASVLMRGFAVALGFVQAIAQAACSDCEVGEETALLQHTLSTEHEHTIEDARPKHGQKDSCEKEVMATQRAWKEAIMDISAAYREDGENSQYVQIAEHAIHELYGYDVRPVMFKPTQAVQDPFRPHFIGALSYFVGYGPTKKKGGFKEDKGFAIAEEIRGPRSCFSTMKSLAWAIWRLPKATTISRMPRPGQRPVSSTPSCTRR